MTISPQATISETPHRVVVGVDGSEGSDRALAWAAAEAERSGAILQVVTAFKPGYEFITPDEVRESMLQVIDRATSQVAALAPTVKVEGDYHEGSPAEVLINTGHHADLLVVGSRGQGGFRGLLLGSVSQQCSLHADCPVVIVP